jgi:RND family efflux transporter MFP subunit
MKTTRSWSDWQRGVGAAVVLATIVACSTPLVDESAEEEEFPARVETRWTDQHEWFVEHPLLVVGMESSFAAHLTRLDDFGPVEEGRLTVALLGPDGGVRQQVEAEAPVRSGIFTPALVPAAPGAGSVRLTYEGPDGQADEVSWPVRVAASVADLGDAPPEAQGIGFLKEQQWRIPFATVAVDIRMLQEAIEMPAVAEAHPRFVADVAAPAEGILIAPPGGLPVPGQSVAAGEILALVSPPLGSTTGWHTLEAELAEARNRLTHAEHEFERAARLVDAGAVPARRLQEAALERDNAAARLAAVSKQAGTFRALAEDDASGTPALPLRTPISGIVAGVDVTAGEPVDHEGRLFRIIDLGNLVVRAEVPEAELARLIDHVARGETLEAAVALPATVRRSVPQEWQPATTLLEMGTQIDAASRTAPVRYTIDNDSGFLRPGMSLRMSIHIGRDHEVLAVPEAAIIDVEGITTAYVQLGGETFEARVVETGMRNGGWIEIRSGLVAGERVATLGAYQVRLAGLSPDAAPAAHSH